MRLLPFVCLALLLAAAPAAAERPNFVLIFADDLGYGDLGCYGAEHVQTPHLDRLAAEGLRLTDFHSSGAVCSPTRAGFYTGRYQQRAGVPGVITALRHRDQGLSPREITFAELLRDAGYVTALFGKWHLGYQTQFGPLQHGFDRFRGFVSGNIDYFSHIDQTGVYDWWEGEQQIEEEGYTTDLITRHAVRFIEQHQDEPFCLVLAHEAPHYPYQGPRDKPDRTVGGKFPIPGSRSDAKEAYREMIESLDAGIGEVLGALDRHRLRKRTVVVFFSDNGPARFGSNGPLRGGKGSLWEGGHRVPGIFSWPGTIPIGTSGELAISLDLMPTVLELADVKVPSGHQLDGRSLAKLLTEGQSLGQRTLFWQHGGELAMREGLWKLHMQNESDPQPTLFHLEQDLPESQDLATKHPDRVAAMRAALAAWREEVQPQK